MALITASQVREHYPGIQGTGEDTLLDTLITRVDALMAAWCGYPPYDGGLVRSLEDQTYTLHLDGPREGEPRCLDLKLRPIVSVTSAYASDDWSYGAGDQVAAGDLVLDARRGWLWLTPSSSSSWFAGARMNKVVVVAGFAATPPDLVAAAAMGVHHLLVNRHRQGVSNASAQGQAVTRLDAGDLLPRATRLALAPYVLGGGYVG